ncbi:hypothetical protein B0O99DRAFT_636015 [Bisporella sp. PMI_857]|nr:hypothetical protein B0O99DRAFT_636015 [Bisporella sp. PMI_857]
MPAYIPDTKAAENGVEFFNWPGPGEAISETLNVTHAVVIPPGASIIQIGAQVGNTDSGAVPEDIEDEITEAFRHIELSLRESGLTGSITDVWGCVYRIDIFSANTDEAYAPALIRVLKRHFGTNRPILKGIEVKKLFRPDLHVEIEVEAFRPAK